MGAGPYRPPLAIAPAQGVAGVLDDRQSGCTSDLREPLHGADAAAEMDGDDASRPPARAMQRRAQGLGGHQS